MSTCAFSEFPYHSLFAEKPSNLDIFQLLAGKPLAHTPVRYSKNDNAAMIRVKDDTAPLPSFVRDKWGKISAGGWD